MGQRFAAIIAVTLLTAATASAVKPGEWTFATEADFQKAAVDHTVVTNLGKVELSRAVEKVAELEDENSIIYDFAQTADEQVFIAIGPQGKLAKLVDKKIEIIAELENEQVFALAADGDDLWVAISSGKNSRVERRTAADPATVAQTLNLPETRYVWDVALVGRTLAVATGTEGKVITFDLTQDKPELIVALDTEQSNVLCLAVHEKLIYAGTDGEGLVYRITPTGEKDEPYQNFIVYDASEPEIGALLIGEDGVVYVGTADAEQARPGRLAEVVEEETGEPADEPADEPAEGDDAGGEPADEPGGEPGGEAGDEPAGDADAADDGGEGDDGTDAEPAEKPKPTAKQYDALREEIKKRLADAAKGKQWKASGGKAGGSTSDGRRAGGTAESSSGSKDGNAVYAIDADGFVRTLFRESAMILSITQHHGKLVIATGNEGEVYRVDPKTEEVTVIADLDAEQIPAVYVLNGKTLLGTANPGQVHHAVDGFADEGTYTADPLDAEQISKWGKMSLVFNTPGGTKLSVQTRSGNVEDPEAGSWSVWSEPKPVRFRMEGEPIYVDVDSPPARFLQYRLTLSSNGALTPSVSHVRLSYVMPNMKPKIDSITAKYPDDEQRKSTVKIEWEASDPNGDALTYTLEVRRMGGGSPFIELDADIEENKYEWDTRTMADGRYEVRVVATDAADNVPSQAMTSRRVTAQVVVDNTAPEAALTAKAGKPGEINLTVRANDALSRVTDVRYSVNGAKDWQMVLPEDLIYDSTSETVAAILSDLAPGNAVVTVRVTDDLGNSRYASATVRVAGE